MSKYMAMSECVERHHHQSTSTRLHLPSCAKAGCLFMAVERDTHGAQLSDEQRLNFFPATPFPSISWILEGELRTVEDQDNAQAPVLSRPLPRILFTGPFRKPSVSWSPGPVHLLIVSFYPEALARLWGIRVGDYLNSIQPIEALVPEEAFDVLNRVGTGEKPLFQQAESALCSLWQDLCEGKGEGVTDMQGWLTLLPARVAPAQAEVGQRQMQRRIKNLAGQSQRDLQLYARVEEALKRSGDGDSEFAGIATEAGYSDQSHLSREIKRVTGLPHKQFVERMKTDEAFWAYRLLSSFLQNGDQQA